ncbi:MAG: hypothetical protein WBF90_26445 [Rivularia sp. (in: cyanobacteria)]
MELGNGWSWATDGVRQRMELGNGWSWELNVFLKAIIKKIDN